MICINIYIDHDSGEQSFDDVLVDVFYTFYSGVVYKSVAPLMEQY